MQRRPTGSPPGGRRPYSYGSYAPQAGPPPMQPQYLPTTGMYGSVGMTMSNMESSLRGGPYGQPQAAPLPPPPQPMRYWPVDQSQGAYGQQAGPYGKASPPQAGGLDLELGDILDAGGPSSAAASAPFTSAGDASAADMFGVPGPFQPRPRKAPSAVPPSPDSPSAGPSPSAAAKPAAGGPLPTAPFSSSAAAASLTDEPPDLSTRKLDDKAEPCQFSGCTNRARVAQRYGKFCNRHVIVAPCGFPGCRDKAQSPSPTASSPSVTPTPTHATMCERHASEGKDALQRILASRAQNVPVCRAFGCFKNDQGRGFCRGHEKLLMATGRLPTHANRRRVNNAYTMCAYPACTKHSQRNHLCRTHGNLVLKQAEELATRAGAGETLEEVLARLQKDIRRCSHPACTKNSQRDRLCTVHYYEKHKLGPVGGPGSRSAGGADAGGAAGKRRAAGRSGRASASAMAAAAAAAAAMAEDEEDEGEDEEDEDVDDDAAAAMAEDFENSAAAGNALRDGERARCLAPGCGNAAAFNGGLCALHAKPQSIRRRGALDGDGGVSDSSAPEEEDHKEQRGHEEEQQEERGGGRGASGEDEEGGGWAGAEKTWAGATSPSAGGCRVRRCAERPAVGGLCLAHLEAFQAGRLPIDALTLESSALQRARAEEARRAEARAEAEATARKAAQAAAALAAGEPLPKKYFCRAEACGRQAQKRGLCKRHFHEQEGKSVRASQKLPRRPRIGGGGGREASEGPAGER